MLGITICGPVIDLATASIAPALPYRTLAVLSATCSAVAFLTSLLLLREGHGAPPAAPRTTSHSRGGGKLAGALAGALTDLHVHVRMHVRMHVYYTRTHTYMLAGVMSVALIDLHVHVRMHVYYTRTHTYMLTDLQSTICTARFGRYAAFSIAILPGCPHPTPKPKT